jgi:hypothetical protein
MRFPQQRLVQGLQSDRLKSANKMWNIQEMSVSSSLRNLNLCDKDDHVKPIHARLSNSSPAD